MKYFLSIILALFLFNCKQEKVEQTSVQTIIDASIEVSGGDLVSSSTIDFGFRDRHYKAIRNSGKFQLERKFEDSMGIVKDVLTNDRFTRYINNNVFVVSDGKEQAYSASVNSVHYFSVLPFGLNDAAVQTTLLETISVKNKKYHTIKVTFDQNGGGEDFEDVFVYWVNKDTNKVDYLAYSYNESDGKGIRFREAYNERYVEGIRFVDYNNYKPEDTSVSLTDLPQLFESGTLKLLSKIELENLVVTLN
ncbi:MAG: DUF6503 family protein [Psychroserpens sp.]|uniref:DUF6503 family protein n=1 Tax=Psychroserpens sp. TaxID=2020870 RepID=UPI003001128A